MLRPRSMSGEQLAGREGKGILEQGMNIILKPFVFSRNSCNR